MGDKGDKIHIYYDLRAAPITFDAAVYFAAAVAKCRLMGFTRFDVHIVASEFRQLTPRDKTYAIKTKKWRLNSIISRLPWLIPGVENISLYKSDDIELKWPRYPENYLPGVTKQFPYLFSELLRTHGEGGDVQVYSPSDFADGWAKKRIHGKPTLILPLRTADFDGGRDSDLRVWFEVHSRLVAVGFRVIVIPDHMDCLNEKKYQQYDWDSCAEAAMDIDLRLALSTNAYATIGINGGHLAPIWLSDATFIIFGILNKFSAVSSLRALRAHGLELSKQPSFFKEYHQQFDWREAILLTPEYVLATAANFLETMTSPKKPGS
ncbi:MAG: hypothetical protein FJ184_06460 [Gammaproteobacteria bacterium]|nr:hypothetical protein [Gammaproteobacteria bacterium]